MFTEATVKSGFEKAQAQEGWRQPIFDVLTGSFPMGGAARAGYLSALYALRANVLPSAYLRSPETVELQRQIEAAINVLRKEE